MTNVCKLLPNICGSPLQSITEQTATNQFLDTKLSQLEKVRQDSDQQMDEKLMHSACTCTCITKMRIILLILLLVITSAAAMSLLCSVMLKAEFGILTVSTQNLGD